MHPVRKQRLILVLVLVALSSAAVGFVTYAMRENMDYFYAPSAFAAGEVPFEKRIRAGGCVVPGSVQRAEDSLDVQFVITDGEAELAVVFDKILPDLFAEGEAAVISGQLMPSGVLRADQVLAKHDENYTPPEVAESMVSHEGCTDGAKI
ncbi:cytochrome c maturation protein CcmE [Microbulbifer variabilis]|jgi:cytochrome c-type biogenesis protein CcmE|uniref:Cytochrome c-type biogenesis protein CcmE n=1 Tax=Microbulbifer variabilis TaxID=266805 RepID=A0ABY4VJG5_9GAMM|nr:cytochrome c maturation protein CcmE [Microbulbifer variabilis]USD22965.1 cytochrome c maturation protein CcmE [Microbulbifer variabilis]